MNLHSDNRKKLQKLEGMFQEASPTQISCSRGQSEWNETNDCFDAVSCHNTESFVKDSTDDSNSTSGNSNSLDVNFSYQRGAIPKNKQNDTRKKFHSNLGPSDQQSIIDEILASYKVMVILRGAPGSGKSYMAKQMLQKSKVPYEKYKLEDFIFSSDDYFYDSSGRYKYNVSKLEDAHVYNKYRVREKAEAGWSPIIVDNTNMKLWEMMPYVNIAVKNGYIIHLLEPSTAWAFNAGKLALRNQHHVAREKIQIMLNKYESGTVNDLLKMLNNTKYTKPLPQMRLVPPIPSPENTMYGDIFHLQTVHSTDRSKAPNIGYSSKEMLNEPLINQNSPKPQRKMLRKISLKLQDNEEQNNEIINDTSATVWESFKEESSSFWDAMHEGKTDEKEHTDIVPTVKSTSQKTLLDLLKEGPTDALKGPTDAPKERSSPESYTYFEPHKIGCPNENKDFVSLRQIYPNKLLQGLWDLFVKCNGDINWAVDILLKEDDLSICDEDYQQNQYTKDNDLTFSCTCERGQKASNEPKKLMSPRRIPEATVNSIRPRPQRIQSNRKAQNSTGAAVELKKAIETSVVLGEEHYSVHIKKLKNMYSRLDEKASATKSRMSVDMAIQTDPITIIDTEEEQDSDSSEFLEIALGNELVNQLSDVFESEFMNGETIHDILKTNVFMPKSLAKELFVLWIESAYNQIEENRQNTLREDESFARLLKNPKYENMKESPDNINELLDMEFAWMIYKNDNDQLKDLVNRQPKDIATHLTQMKLCEIFPNIPRETILDVFEEQRYNFSETVAVLQGNLDECNSTSQKLLLQQAIDENELLNNEIMFEQQDYSRCPLMHSASNSLRPDTQLELDEAKRMALHDFEETRNLAAHHSQLKAECYQKAKEAIQKGNCSVAVYYSQIASLHKKKIDMYNHRAANCIMDVHKYAQNNPDLLDLHYLHVVEAMSCLDLFIDRHITALRNLPKSYKHVFIITGRGLHSAGGVSTIKSKVKSRLKERSLRWSEVNPGLLKVKIFSASRYYKNI